MDIKELVISNFRGIELLTWRPTSGLTCLIGPGDSTKTTILDAIDLVLGARWAVQLSDHDFHKGDTSRPIVITATIGKLPDVLIKDDRLGLDLRGWKTDTQTLVDEPDVDCEAVLTIQFTADDSLEPEWTVLNDRREEPRTVTTRDREQLGVIRLSADVDRHLAWGRGSALSRATEDLSEVARVIATANREARKAVARLELTKLTAASAVARQAAIEAGVSISGDYRPGLDATTASNYAAQLSLHHAEVPVRSAGLATRRLNALAFQLRAVKAGATLLVDEVEHGLEPFRLRHLLRHLKSCVGAEGRALLTTHSPVTIEELPAASLSVVRNHAGKITVRALSDDLQALVRSNPEALLARKVVVCEGKTEIGLCRGVRDLWEQSHDGTPLTHTGSAFALGGGGSTGERAKQLHSLGYEVAVLADADKPLNPDAKALKVLGIRVLIWKDGLSLEQRIALDVELSDLAEIVDLAGELFDGESVIAAIASRVPGGPKLSTSDLATWIAAGGDEARLRNAVGQAAKDKKWFKDVSRGEHLGRLVKTALTKIPTTDLARKLSALGNWLYE